jgi:hypothetical protein
MDMTLIHLGMTHPDIALIWAGIILTGVNSLAIVYLWRTK